MIPGRSGWVQGSPDQRVRPAADLESSQKRLQGHPFESMTSPSRPRRARSTVAGHSMEGMELTHFDASPSRPRRARSSVAGHSRESAARPSMAGHSMEGSDELNLSQTKLRRRSAAAPADHAADPASTAFTEMSLEEGKAAAPVGTPVPRRASMRDSEAVERRKTARRSLVEAMENHDIQQIRKSLEVAATSGVSRKEVSAAKRLLDFEVSQNIVREVNEVRDAVDHLARLVQEVEERASRAEEWKAQNSAASVITGAMPVESWIADIVSRVEEGLWEALQPRVEASIRESIKKAKQELVECPSTWLSPGGSHAGSRKSSRRDSHEAYARPPPLVDLEVQQPSSRPSSQPPSSNGSRRPSLRLEARRDSRSSFGSGVGTPRFASKAALVQPYQNLLTEEPIPKPGIDNPSFSIDVEKPAKKARKPISETDLKPYFQDMVESVPRMILEPQNWGIRVKDVKAFYGYIHKNLKVYVKEQQDLGEDVNENLHVVTPRFIKPWTKMFTNCSLASVINANELVTKKVNSLEELMTARVFISHCWNEHFGDFINTMNSVLHQDDVVWICAISICQNVDIQSILGESIQDSPFWRAMPHCRRVAMLIDRNAEPFERAWCALEEYLATYLLRLPFSICMPDNMDEEAWVEVDRKLQEFSIRDCKASEESDKQKIMGIIADKADIIDRVVRDESQKACFAARVMKVAVSGTTSELVPLAMNALAQVLDGAGRSILHICAQWGRVEQLQGLVDSELKLNSRCSAGKAPLHYAAEAGHAATAQLLLGCNADVDARDQLRWTPLSAAASKGQVHVAKALLSASADIDTEDSEGHTPLLNTAVSGAQDGADLEIAQLLLEMRANIHAKDKHGHSVLVLSAQAGKHDITQLFIQSGANLDERDVDGCTPLMFAAGIGHLEVARALLQGKADPLLQDATGCNALAFAEDTQDKDIVQLLETSTTIANLRARLSRQSLSGK